jgi:hypothetical protein
LAPAFFRGHAGADVLFRLRGQMRFHFFDETSISTAAAKSVAQPDE